MPNEAIEQGPGEEHVPSAPPGGAGHENPAETDGPGQTVGAIQDVPPDTAATDQAPRPQTQTGGREQGQERIQVLTENSQAGILAVVSDRGTAINVAVQQASAAQPKLDTFITIGELKRCKRSYQSLQSSTIAQYSGLLLQERILLLSCYDEAIALNAATALAYQIQAVKRELMTVDEEGQVNYRFRHLIDWLAGRNAKDDLVAVGPANVCLWIATNNTESDAPSAIIRSLLTQPAQISLYKTRLDTQGLCLICVLPPHRIQEYISTQHNAPLPEWKIDFLSPLLEDHGHESLAQKIAQQRSEGKWKKDDGEFYKEIVECLKAKNLTAVIEIGRQESPVDASMASQLFDRRDPVIDAVLYCATYFPNLSPQDFSYLVELYLGDDTEEVAKRPEPAATQDGAQPGSLVEVVPLVRRWKRETDAILRRCKLASVSKRDDKRVVDFQVDGLRDHLKEYIRDEHYFFYDSSFNLLRRRGLLFSPKKELAESARQLLVEVALQYDAEEGLVKDNATSGPPSQLFDSGSPNETGPFSDIRILHLSSPLVYLPIAAIVLIAVLLGAFEVVKLRRLKNEQFAAESRRLEIERELASLNREWRAQPPSKSRVFSATLLPIGTRGASTAAQLSPPPNTEVLELKLVITGESYRTYSAEIQKPAFAVDFTITDLTIEIVEGSKAVVLRLPQRFFDEGEFRILLRGMTSDNKMEDIGEYVFQTRR